MHKPPSDRSLTGVMPNESWPFFDEEMIQAVESVIRSGRVNYWTGDQGVSFEREFASYVGTKHAIAVTNGTAALELAIQGLGISNGDQVIVPSRTFIATASAVANCGARPIFADVERDSQNLSIDSVSSLINEKTKAIIAVHLAGWPCDMMLLSDLAKQAGIFLIEDCAQAHGATIHGRQVGSLGHAAAFSFCQDKIMTTLGEGGMLVTNSDDIYERAWKLKDHGKSPDIRFGPKKPGSGFRWVHESIGTNFRMTEAQSAVGRIQLARLPDWLAKRRTNAEFLASACKKASIFRVPEAPAEIEHAMYKFYTFVRPDLLAHGWSRDRVLEELRSDGVRCAAGSCSEVYLEKAFPESWRPTQRLTTARELGETSIMFMVHPTLRKESMVAAAKSIARIGSEAFAADKCHSKSPSSAA